LFHIQGWRFCILGSYPAESIIEEVLCYHWLIHDSVPDICLDVVLSSPEYRNTIHHDVDTKFKQLQDQMLTKIE
jgi:hypothetical protein